MLRLLLLFAGIMLMINGCNGLLTGTFGTQKLRSLTLAEATTGVGDADFVQITDAEPGALPMTVQSGSQQVLMYPLVASGTSAAAVRSNPVTVSVIAWVAVDDGTPPAIDQEVRGFIETPKGVGDRIPNWATQGIALHSPVTYLHMGERPADRRWLLLMLIGGAALAILPQLYHHHRRTAS
ncbi:hypothetical protein LEM8419_01438 [Neolewinella maritima]|uniref:Lipoprotein n=1 Tax=Neolewinella maritima TaxID=1383882 RepID=A0ABM9B0I1_9BACT|nr:hypothetical protein LEM8419_01438 [Neolewinella maritima]